MHLRAAAFGILMALAVTATSARPAWDAVAAQQVNASSVETPAATGTQLRQGSTNARPPRTDSTLTQVSNLSEGAKSLVGQLIASLMVIGVAWLIIRALVWVVESLAERSARRRLLFMRTIPFLRLFVWGTAAYVIVATVFGVDRSGLVAASAAIGVGLGFAAQDVIKNVLGGLLIIVDQPFQIGDRITVGGTYGEVRTIGLRSTRIVTLDDSLVTVPNAQVISSQVSNANSGALDCQVVIDLYLPPDTDIEQARSIAFEAAATSQYVYLKKPIVVLVKDEFQERFSTRIVVKAYVLDTRFESLFASDVTRTAKLGFQQAGLLPARVAEEASA